MLHVLVLLGEVPHLQVRVRDSLQPAHFLYDLEALEERGRGEKYRPEDNLVVRWVVEGCGFRGLKTSWMSRRVGLLEGRFGSWRVLLLTMNRYTWFSSAVRSKPPPSNLLLGPTVGCSLPKSTSSSQIAGSSKTSMIAGCSHALRTDLRAHEPAKYKLGNSACFFRRCPNICSTRDPESAASLGAGRRPGSMMFSSRMSTSRGYGLSKVRVSPMSPDYILPRFLLWEHQLIDTSTPSAPPSTGPPVRPRERRAAG